jgi:DNA-binding CsgD family transcriptional regulator
MFYSRSPVCVAVIYAEAPWVDQIYAPMLAQLDSRLPSGRQWRYKPKLRTRRDQLARPGGSRTVRAMGCKWSFTVDPDPVDEGRVGPPDDGAGADFEPTQHPFAPLSPREWEVATLVAQGAKNREIAERLVLAQRTLESHLERTNERLEISNRAQLATWQRGSDVAATNDVTGGTGPADRTLLRRLRVVGN